MSVREEGEFELILGNRQLLSVLFIVVVLLGVFFAMGFLAGRSTSTTVMTAKEAPKSEMPRVVEPPQAPVVIPDETKFAASPPSAATDQPAPRPTRTASTPAPTAPAPAAAAKASSGSGFIETPPSGTYLQAAATRREDAESMLGLLKQDGLKGFVTPSPKAEMFRVIIGPLPDNETIASTREKLNNRGIKAPFVIRY